MIVLEVVDVGDVVDQAELLARLGGERALVDQFLTLLGRQVLPAGARLGDGADQALLEEIVEDALRVVAVASGLMLERVNGSAANL